MNKSNNFSGQPILSQLLSFISKQDVKGIANDFKADAYCKSFRTWDHLVSMLYAVLSDCKSLREVTSGLLAWQHKLNHLGLQRPPKRSTISDGNKSRPSPVFERIYQHLYNKYHSFLSDSKLPKKFLNRVYLIDSTIIPLFQDILKTSGRTPSNGKKKGGIKVNTMLNAGEGMPCFIDFTSASKHDRHFLDRIDLPEGSFLAMDKAYIDYRKFKEWNDHQIYLVTRLKRNADYEPTYEYDIPKNAPSNLLNDEVILVKDPDNSKQSIELRKVTWWDDIHNHTFEFITNNFKLSGSNIALIYQYRWEIEKLFRYLKQNFTLKYFLGDSANALKIQIWTALIAMLILTVIQNQVKRVKEWHFSNMVAMIRHHLVNYIKLFKFLCHPEKAYQQRNRDLAWQNSLFGQ